MTATLQRLTTEYVDVEDRIRLAGEREDGTTAVIWLSRRLLQRLLPMLFDWLEREAADGLRAEVLLGFAQQAAQAELTPQAPVAAPPGSSAWLARSVDVARAADLVGLTFKGATPEETATLTLAAKPLRQWLAIVYQAYGCAEWPIEVWPQWMRESAPATRQPATVLH